MRPAGTAAAAVRAAAAARTGQRAAAWTGQPLAVAACIVRDGQGRVLMARRRPEQIAGGTWEIPGGKVEPGETPIAAAGRELFEETGLRAEGLRPLATYEHRFPTRRIELMLFLAQSWSGTPAGGQGQRLEWVAPERPQVHPVLESNLRALRLLSLPRLVLCADGVAGDVADRAEDWAAGWARRAGAISAGAVLFDGRRINAAQRIALGRRLGAALARQGIALWLAGGPHCAARSGAALVAQEGGDGVIRPPSAPAMISAKMTDDPAGLAARPDRQADAFIVDARGRLGDGAGFWAAFRQLTAATAAPVFARIEDEARAIEAAFAGGAHGICVAGGHTIEHRRAVV